MRVGVHGMVIVEGVRGETIGSKSQTCNQQLYAVLTTKPFTKDLALLALYRAQRRDKHTPQPSSSSCQGAGSGTCSRPIQLRDA